MRAEEKDADGDEAKCDSGPVIAPNMQVPPIYVTYRTRFSQA
jgi:hypothetical protein